MSLKKLSLAAALSIGILSVNGLASVAQPAMMQPAVPQEAACPVQATVCPVCQQNPCTCKPVCPKCQQTPCTCIPEAKPCGPISSCCPNSSANATVLGRQAFAYPTIGHSSVVMPRGKNLTQIGGDKEAVALPTSTSGMALAPEYGAGPLTLYPKYATGGACAIPVCPNQLVQGTDITRCTLPNISGFYQAIGAAAPLMQTAPLAAPCSPCAVPASGSANSVIIPTGGAAPISPIPASLGGLTQPNPINIQTSSGLEIQRTIFVPGAAAPIAPSGCPVGEQYPDVSNNQYAGCDINTLTVHGALAGYPDHTYKPSQAMIRSELASAMVAGLELRNVPGFGNKMIFKDVPNNHWAKSNIDKAYNRGLMSSLPGDKFKPYAPVSNAEALSTMGKAISPSISSADAQNVLKSYPDANQIPSWATIPVAQAISAGINKNLADSSHIRPNETASRADVAAMLKELRVKLCLEPVASKTVGAACPVMEPKTVSSTIPLLKVKMHDIVTARTSLIGDKFMANSTEPVTINGQYFPAGSEVRGRVVEVIRPTMGDNGGIRLAFDNIQNKGCKANLPKDVLSATVIKEKNANIIGRIVALPFTWTGKVVGIAGRTVGGGVTILGDAGEGVLNNFGNGTNELFNAEFRAAGRSYISSGRELVVGAADIVRDGVSGIAGVLKESGDEVAYVVSPDGSRIAQVNSKENLSIAFGCK